MGTLTSIKNWNSHFTRYLVYECLSRIPFSILVRVLHQCKTPAMEPMEFYHHMSYRTRDLTILRCFICIKKINKITLQNIYSVAGFVKGLFFCVCVCVCVCELFPIIWIQKEKKVIMNFIYNWHFTAKEFPEDIFLVVELLFEYKTKYIGSRPRNSLNASSFHSLALYWWWWFVY